MSDLVRRDSRVLACHVSTQRAGTPGQAERWVWSRRVTSLPQAAGLGDSSLNASLFWIQFTAPVFWSLDRPKRRVSTLACGLLFLADGGLPLPTHKYFRTP